MAAALKELGIEVIVGLDLDKRGFDAKVRDFSRALAAGADTGIFFYAGHGLQVAGRNYLVPVDAQLANERDLDFEAVSLDFVLKQMELEREGKTNIVFLDACRDNPLARNLARSMGTRSASIGRGLAQVQTGVGTFIAYSTQPGNVALDGVGRNSPFTAALAKGVKAPGRNLTAVMIEVRREVLAATNGKQVPWDHSALTGDFYFHLASAPSLLPKIAPAPPDTESEALKKRLQQVEEELKKQVRPAADRQAGASSPSSRSACARSRTPTAPTSSASSTRSASSPASDTCDAQHRQSRDRRHPAADRAARPGAAHLARRDRQARGGAGAGARGGEEVSGYPRSRVCERRER